MCFLTAAQRPANREFFANAPTRRELCLRRTFHLPAGAEGERPFACSFALRRSRGHAHCVRVSVWQLLRNSSDEKCTMYFTAVSVSCRSLGVVLLFRQCLRACVPGCSLYVPSVVGASTAVSRVRAEAPVFQCFPQLRTICDLLTLGVTAGTAVGVAGRGQQLGQLRAPNLIDQVAFRVVSVWSSTYVVYHVRCDTFSWKTARVRAGCARDRSLGL